MSTQTPAGGPPLGDAATAPPAAAAPAEPAAVPSAEQTMTISVPPLAPQGPTDADRELAATLDTGTALLVVARGPGTGNRFRLSAEVVTAGRHPDSDIFLDDVTVSRRHAEFRLRDGRYVVRDVGSLNGTYVNRDRVDEVAVRTGDEIQIGKFRLHYVSAGTEPADRDA